jgi:CBS-domain-containing membrane protein
LATEAIHIMEKKEVDNLPVLDEQARSVGVVDIQDLLKLRVV